MTNYAEELIEYVSAFGRFSRSDAIAFLDENCDPQWQQAEEMPPSEVIFLDEIDDED